GGVGAGGVVVAEERRAGVAGAGGARRGPVGGVAVAARRAVGDRRMDAAIHGVAADGGADVPVVAGEGRPGFARALGVAGLAAVAVGRAACRESGELRVVAARGRDAADVGAGVA